ncbi:DegT/DnrJ/EryC1/StrS family aminotransferase [Neptunicella marina]|uniref:DegT/DnrJ/EryC1/StrS family aminotransferase n=1 Tax=Neptunicella marina TaxID=2125989 RepID=A0A8J6LW37_9ALTE|nr:DegT/DnrJ/EryC1/StrS family aminotransferase [Neptunicella marina]MBC3765009.1 DegT/DnrJ/EryC1/StrS family aminotransferase [Neptunicella marina]
MQFIDLQAQLAHIRPAIDARIAKVLDHGKFIMGPEVFELEKKLAEYVGIKHCISCANGTDALQLSLMALDIGPGDTVITTAFSFFSTAEVIPLVGATPYFVDIIPSTYNICPEALQAGIHNARKQGLKPKAVIAVDMFGLPANYPEIQAICDKEGLYLIEDAAQGFGGSINGQNAGSFGDIATTSFFPAKPLGCYGDGGAIFTDSDELATLCESLRVHGKGEHKYQNMRIGLNSRLDTIQAAILLEKLGHFPQELIQRQKAATHYSTELAAVFVTPAIPEGYQSSWAQYTVTPKKGKRDNWMSSLKKAGIPTAVYYPIGLNKQVALQHYPSDPTPITERLCEQVFSLPMHGYLDHQQVDNIINIINATNPI